MKVVREMSSFQLHKQAESQRKISWGFKQMVEIEAGHVRREELQQLMDKIADQGDKLLRFHSFQDLVRFKHLIKGFLEKAVYESYELDSSFSFNPRSDSKQLVIVKQVEEKPAELTEKVLEQEEKSVYLLEMIGEIKGLLVNLYM